jgi:hypothetical protein
VVCVVGRRAPALISVDSVLIRKAYDTTCNNMY